MKDFQTINQNSRLLKTSNRSGSHRNCIRLGKNNTKEHEMKKVEICWELLKLNQEFITEAVFTNGKRADIFILDTGVAIEVLHSETQSQFEEKIKGYPDEISIISIKSDQAFEESMIYG